MQPGFPSWGSESLNCHYIGWKGVLANATMSGADRTMREAIAEHASHLPVEDLHIQIPDHKLLNQFLGEQVYSARIT